MYFLCLLINILLALVLALLVEVPVYRLVQERMARSKRAAQAGKEGHLKDSMSASAVRVDRDSEIKGGGGGGGGGGERVRASQSSGADRFNGSSGPRGGSRVRQLEAEGGGGRPLDEVDDDNMSVSSLTSFGSHYDKNKGFHRI